MDTNVAMRAHVMATRRTRRRHGRPSCARGEARRHRHLPTRDLPRRRCCGTQFGAETSRDAAPRKPHVDNHAELCSWAVLPSWATILIAAVTGLLASLTALIVQLAIYRFQRRAQKHTHRLEAASDFSKHFFGATDAVKYAIENMNDDDARGKANHYAGEIRPLLGRISLLFGGESAVMSQADAAATHLRNAGNEVAARNVQAARSEVGVADSRLAAFEQAFRQHEGL
jgi:hypothetical protein